MVHKLPTVGDALDVLAQCLTGALIMIFRLAKSLTLPTALRVMFCAGWIHRDISTGNILAIQDENGRWKIKLADLEYAKRFPSVEGSSDPKTVSHDKVQRTRIEPDLS